MPQLSLFFEESALPDLQPEAVSNLKSQSSQAEQPNSSIASSKRIAPPAVQIQVALQLEEKQALYGFCQSCGLPILFPGLDRSFCSNPNLACGSSGWITNRQWRLNQTHWTGGVA
ncbi:hypothetical protein LEP3755_65730 (plasmid) [Leptolyngbya sp. NIES-3755]|nr:hypothetical protein LEP3755_65730 [Leptolyngbya sp. NIES-3755]